MTRVQALEQAHDGPVPRPLLAEAWRLDLIDWNCAAAAERAAREARHCRIGTVTLKPAGLVDAIARAMIVQARASGGAPVERRHMIRAGFTDAQLDAHGDAAVARARALAPEIGW